MIAARKIPVLIVLAGLGFLAYGYFSPDNDAPDLEEMIAAAASDKMARPVAIETQFRNQIGDWTLLCGVATEPDGSELKIAALTGGTSGEAQYESGNFCALANTDNASQLTEFDFGSTDMPAMDWLTQHDLPPEILTESGS